MSFRFLKERGFRLEESREIPSARTIKKAYEEERAA
jgi:hypothetical protein